MRVSLPKALASLAHKKRAIVREPRSETVLLFSDSRFLGRANLLDESQLGARVRSMDGDLHRSVRYILKPSTATVAKVRGAWQREREAGYEYESLQNLRGFVASKELEHIRTAWAAMAQQNGLIAPGGAFGRR